MKVKTSITLDATILREMDRLRHDSRSAFVSRAIEVALRAERDRLRDTQDLATMNRHAPALNQEAEDVIGFQAL